MYRRVLEGESLALLVTDGNPGLYRVLDLVYPYIPRQRCWVHKLRNLASKLPKRVEKVCLEGAKAIYQSTTHRETIMRFRDWASKWHLSQPKAVACLETDLDDLQLSKLTLAQNSYR